MHVWPELRNLHSDRPSTAASRSASSKTMNGALPPSSSETFFTVLRALRHQELPDLGRAGEAELADDRVRRQLAADHRRVLGVAGDDVEARPSARPARSASSHERERRERRLLGRLQHHRAAGGERGRGLARDHRRGEVPRRDPGGDADRLLDHDDAPVGRRRRDRVAVDALGLLAEPLEERRRVGDLAARLGERLALLGGDQAARAPPGARASGRRSAGGSARAPCGAPARPDRRARPPRSPGGSPRRRARHVRDHLAGRGIPDCERFRGRDCGHR